MKLRELGERFLILTHVACALIWTSSMSFGALEEFLLIAIKSDHANQIGWFLNCALFIQVLTGIWIVYDYKRSEWQINVRITLIGLIVGFAMVSFDWLQIRQWSLFRANPHSNWLHFLLESILVVTYSLCFGFRRNPSFNQSHKAITKPE